MTTPSLKSANAGVTGGTSGEMIDRSAAGGPVAVLSEPCGTRQEPLKQREPTSAAGEHQLHLAVLCFWELVLMPALLH